jgi:hypothetical protein
MRDATKAVMRQGMEYRRGFPLKPALGASTQDSFDHARENAERESSNREEGQRCHRQASPRSTIPPIFMEARSAFSAGGRGAAVYQVRGRSFRFQTAAGAHDHLRGGRRRQHRDRSETYRASGLARRHWCPCAGNSQIHLRVMARLEGFEPPTLGLEGRCSIQLSYRRVP